MFWIRISAFFLYTAWEYIMFIYETKIVIQDFCNPTDLMSRSQ